MDKNNKIALFEGQGIRQEYFAGETYFSIVDIIKVLTGTSLPRRYWSDLKTKLKKEGSEVYEKIVQLKISAEDGKNRETDMANNETVLRIIQSIPSPKAEPFKMWLASLGKERIDEIQDPELATKRTRALYVAKGYSDSWIEKRMRGIVIREELTDEWKNRGVREAKDYEILTAEISKATFGVTPSEYKELKGLERENLRDHMDDFELIFNMLGERATTEIHRTEDSKGLPKLKDDAKAGGDIAGGARKKLEERLGKSVVSKGNYLKNAENKKLK
jgi:hypothetical protein